MGFCLINYTSPRERACSRLPGRSRSPRSGNRVELPCGSSAVRSYWLCVFAFSSPNSQPARRQAGESAGGQFSPGKLAALSPNHTAQSNPRMIDTPFACRSCSTT